MSTRHRFTVGPEHEGLRLDRALTLLEPAWSRSRVRRLIDNDRVRVDDARPRPAIRVTAGMVIEVDEPAPQPVSTRPQEIPLTVLYEDADLLVIDKPAGLVIHPAAGNPTGTLVNALLHHCRDLSGIGGAERPGIVHRLDKDTTGAMVVAKSDRAHLALSLAFQQRRVEKTYLAICYGVPDPAEGVIDEPVGRHPRDRKRMAIRRDGRPARTLYRCERVFAGNALVACRLVTGRTHQIRVHLAHRGHGLVGDPMYSGRQWRNLTDPGHRTACRDFPRQALHAWRLAFVHPVSGVELELEAPLPDDLEALLEALTSRP